MDLSSKSETEIPRPYITITNTEYKESDHIAPFCDYDFFGPLWDVVPFFNPKLTFEEWTTNEFMTKEQLNKYGAYYIGDNEDMYAFSHFVYYVDGEFMPVFKKITGYDIFNDFRWMRIILKEHKRGYAVDRHFPDPICLNPTPTLDKLKKLITNVVEEIASKNVASSSSDKN